MSPGGARPRSRRARRGAEEGVSPVVGMVLILAISVLGILAVTNWGLPAITQLQTGVEMRGVMDEFRDLDATMQHLISGSAGQTTFKWQPSIQQGAIDVDQNGARWLAAADVADWFSLNWTEGNNTNNSLVIRSNITASGLTIKAWKWDSGAATELRVNKTDDCTQPPPTSLNASEGRRLFLHTNTSGCAAVNVANVVLSFALYQGSTLLHRGYLVDVGHVHWNSVVGAQGPRHVYSSNGGILSGPADGLVVQSPLALPPPRDFKNSTGVETTSLFVRFVKMNGTASFSATTGGAEKFSIYLNLVGTWTLGTTENVTAAYVYVWGPLQAPVYQALTDAVAGYRFVQTTEDGVTFLKHREGAKPFRFNAVYSLVTVEV